MAYVSFSDLLSTGAHFGHVTRKWNPNFQPYVLMEKNGVHIINLEETIEKLDRAIDFIKEVVKRNGEVLFVGTKKQAKDIVQQEADRCGMFYVVERWLGGTLTNFSTIKKSIKRLQLLEKEGSSIYENMTKKEIQKLNRERIKLSDQHRGIKDMRRPPEVVIVVDAYYEATVIKEANRLEIPVVSIVDSNTDPRPINYPIPANDDSIRTIQLIISAIASAIIEVRTAEELTEETAAAEAQLQDKPSFLEQDTKKIEETPPLSKIEKPSPEKPDNREQAMEVKTVESPAEIKEKTKPKKKTGTRKSAKETTSSTKRTAVSKAKSSTKAKTKTKTKTETKIAAKDSTEKETDST